MIEALNTQIDQLGAVVDAHFGRHPDAEIYASQPGLGVILAAWVLGEFGDVCRKRSWAITIAKP